MYKPRQPASTVIETHLDAPGTRHTTMILPRSRRGLEQSPPIAATNDHLSKLPIERRTRIQSFATLEPCPRSLSPPATRETTRARRNFLKRETIESRSFDSPFGLIPFDHQSPFVSFCHFVSHRKRRENGESLRFDLRQTRLLRVADRGSPVGRCPPGEKTPLASRSPPRRTPPEHGGY